MQYAANLRQNPAELIFAISDPPFPMLFPLHDTPSIIVLQLEINCTSGGIDGILANPDVPFLQRLSSLE
jgi:hypothetical protein